MFRNINPIRYNLSRLFLLFGAGRGRGGEVHPFLVRSRYKWRRVQGGRGRLLV